MAGCSRFNNRALLSEDLFQPLVVEICFKACTLGQLLTVRRGRTLQGGSIVGVNESSVGLFILHLGLTLKPFLQPGF